MNTLSKSIVIAVASLGLGSAALAVADTGAASSGGDSHWAGTHSAKSAERMAKRLSTLHDKLGLSSAQESAWKTFTDRLQTTAPTKTEGAPVANLTAPERADRMAAALQNAQQRAVVRAQSVKEFYVVLSPEQQKIFDSQFQGHHHHFGRG